jgi:hypothetical protein
MDQPRDPAALRTVLGRAALEVVGEGVYADLTVERILDRSGRAAGRSTFYRLFANADRCYLAGYAEAGGRLVEELLARCAEAPDWPAGVRAALDRLAATLIAQPALAGGLILPGWSANEGAAALHAAEVGRLRAAVDRGREVTPAGHTPPPAAADFVVGAVEATAVQALSRRAPEEFSRRVPDLVFLAVATYLGADPARRILDC